MKVSRVVWTAFRFPTAVSIATVSFAAAAAVIAAVSAAIAALTLVAIAVTSAFRSSILLAMVFCPLMSQRIPAMMIPVSTEGVYTEIR